MVTTMHPPWLLRTRVLQAPASDDSDQTTSVEQIESLLAKGAWSAVLTASKKLIEKGGASPSACA
jgi:hypothetical protein